MESDICTAEQAIAALEFWHAHQDVAKLLGVSPDPRGPVASRSVDVSAGPPKVLDHFIHVLVPTSTDVSRIPHEVCGVRVVITLLDSPEAIAYGRDPPCGPPR